MKHLTRHGPLLIAIAALLWALDGILRRSLFSLPPIIIVFFEHLIGLIIITPFFLPLLKKEKLSRGEWGAVFWVSILSGVLGTLWFTTALLKINFIPFSVVFLLQKLQPLFAITTAAILLKEKLNRSYIGWATVALIAAYFVTFENGIVNFGTGQGTIVAALFALGAAFAWGTSTAISRFALVKHSHTFITGLRFGLTTLIALGFVLLLGEGSQLAAPSGSQLGRLVIIALSTGMVALWIYYRGLKQTEAKVATIVELTFPLTAILIDIYLYNTTLAPSQYIAAAILVFAMYRVSKLRDSVILRYRARVVEGKKQGRRIGFPTLNVAIRSSFSHQHGIYAGWVEVNGTKHMGAFHFGPRPVFNDEDTALEVHIIEAEIETPETVSFELVKRIRDIQNFESVDELKKRIAKDIQEIKKILHAKDR